MIIELTLFEAGVAAAGGSTFAVAEVHVDFLSVVGPAPALAGAHLSSAGDRSAFGDCCGAAVAVVGLAVL